MAVCMGTSVEFQFFCKWDFMKIPRDFRRFSNLKPTKYLEIEIFEVAVIPGSAWSPGGARSGRRNSRSWRRRSWWKNSHRGSLQSRSSGTPHAGLKRAIFLTSPVETPLKSAKTIHDENDWSKFSWKKTHFTLLICCFWASKTSVASRRWFCCRRKASQQPLSCGTYSCEDGISCPTLDEMDATQRAIVADLRGKLANLKVPKRHDLWLKRHL